MGGQVNGGAVAVGREALNGLPNRSLAQPLLDPEQPLSSSEQTLCQIPFKQAQALLELLPRESDGNDRSCDTELLSSSQAFQASIKQFNDSIKQFDDSARLFKHWSIGICLLIALSSAAFSVNPYTSVNPYIAVGLLLLMGPFLVAGVNYHSQRRLIFKTLYSNRETVTTKVDNARKLFWQYMRATGASVIVSGIGYQFVSKTGDVLKYTGNLLNCVCYWLLETVSIVLGNIGLVAKLYNAILSLLDNVINNYIVAINLTLRGWDAVSFSIGSGLGAILGAGELQIALSLDTRMWKSIGLQLFMWAKRYQTMYLTAVVFNGPPKVSQYSGVLGPQTLGALGLWLGILLKAKVDDSFNRSKGSGRDCVAFLGNFAVNMLFCLPQFFINPWIAKITGWLGLLVQTYGEEKVIPGLIALNAMYLFGEGYTMKQLSDQNSKKQHLPWRVICNYLIQFMSALLSVLAIIEPHYAQIFFNAATVLYFLSKPLNYHAIFDHLLSKERKEFDIPLAKDVATFFEVVRKEENRQQLDVLLCVNGVSDDGREKDEVFSDRNVRLVITGCPIYVSA